MGAITRAPCRRRVVWKQVPPRPSVNGDCIVGWPEYQRGQVAVVFATLYATPAKKKEMGDTIGMRIMTTAHRLYRDQIDVYRRLVDSHPDKFRLISSTKELDSVIEHWSKPVPDGEGHPVGLIYLMEGADGIRSPHELGEWYDLGLRMIGLAWAGTRYCGGTSEPGPLTDEGRKLISAMADYNFILDLSHMDEAAALESLDRYEGPVMATHANCAALMQGLRDEPSFARPCHPGFDRTGWGDWPHSIEFISQSGLAAKKWKSPRRSIRWMC